MGIGQYSGHKEQILPYITTPKSFELLQESLCSKACQPLSLSSLSPPPEGQVSASSPIK